MTPQRREGKLVLFIMDGLSYRHILPQGLSAFGEMGKWLEQNGSMALLNTMGYGGADRFRSAMTMACGIRAYGNEMAKLVLQTDEKLDADTALDAYRRRLGFSPLFRPLPPFKPLVFPMLADLKWRNERLLKKPLLFGIVATSLERAGLRILAIGCGDPLLPDLVNTSTPNYFRHGLLVALGEKGTGMGLTAGLLKRDPNMPFGVAVDGERWREAVKAGWEVADALVLFPGETLRADLYGSERLLNRVIMRELNLIRPVVERMDAERDLLLVFSLAPPQKSRYEHSFLCAVGKGISPGGFLTSTTTHRKGIVSILDIPATVLDFFSVQPMEPINGSPIRSDPGSRFDKERLFQMAAKAQFTDANMRVVVLAFWCIVQALLFSVVAFVLLKGQRVGEEDLTGLLLSMLGLLAVLTPLLHLTCGLDNWLWSILMSIVTPVAIGAFSSRTYGGKGLCVFGVLIAASVFLWDGFTQGSLSLNTPFGYSTFFGGRYYGLGNVGMGLTLGSLIALGFLLNHRGLTVALSTFGTVLSGAPFWGANVGGALTGAVVTETALLTGKFRWWHLLAMMLAAFALLAAFAAVELTQPQPLTHWGRFVQEVAHGGAKEVFAMVQTKLGITFRAFRAIHWSIALASHVLLLAALRFQMGKAGAGERGVGQSWQWWTVVFGSVAACLLNDSGPQTPVAFAFFPLCVLSLQSLTGLRSLPASKPLG